MLHCTCALTDCSFVGMNKCTPHTPHIHTRISEAMQRKYREFIYTHSSPHTPIPPAINILHWCGIFVTTDETILIYFFFIFIFIFIFLWLCWVFVSVRGLSVVAASGGPLFIAVRGPLTIAASLVAEHRLQTRRLSSCGARA